MKLGEKQKLTIVKKVDFGVYLAEPEKEEVRVLLPAKQAPETAASGMNWKCFYTKIPGTE